jgi:Holliday junction resolvase-like predicted endonuclease
MFSPKNPRAWGESIEGHAANYFKTVHPQAHLVVKNYRKPFGEIDLIFLIRDGELSEWVFIEVRARLGSLKGLALQSGIESITRKKLLRIRKVIEVFLMEPQVTASFVRACRFDVLDWNGTEFAHYPNIWI